MTEFDPRKPLSRPSTPPWVSWIDFLLNEELLEKHLQKECADPSATHLLALFWYQAENAANLTKEQEEPELDPTTEEPIVVPDKGDNKKVKALKLLALKTAAYLNWNLDMLEESVPVMTVQELLLELMKLASPEEPDPMKHALLDLHSLSDQAVFAILLFHRWCVTAVVKDSFPQKKHKVNNSQVPGLIDPSCFQNNARESVIKAVKENLADSISFLERFLESNRSITVPTLHSFGSVDPNSDTIDHCWEKGKKISAKEMICQVCYDLGSTLFWQEDYDVANVHFTRAKSIFYQLKDPALCNVDEEKLSGYGTVRADARSLGLPSDSQELTLFQRVERSKKHQYEGLIRLLVEDNMKQELQIPYRDSIKQDIQSSGREDNLATMVDICNVVRAALDSQVAPQNFLEIIRSNLTERDFFIQVCVDTVSSPKTTVTQRNSLKRFLNYVCHTLPTSFVKLLSTELKGVFTKEEIDKFTDLAQRLPASADKDRHEASKVELQRALQVTYDTGKIQQLSEKLSIKDPLFCSVDEEKLLGYCTACAGILSFALPSDSQELTLIQRVEKSKKQHYEDLIRLLVEDNMKQELRMPYRDSLKEELQHSDRKDDLPTMVNICNVVRAALDSQVAPQNFLEIIRSNVTHRDFFIKVCVDTVSSPKTTITQRNNLKRFLGYLCHTQPASFVKLMSTELKSLFTKEELDKFSDLTKVSPTASDVDEGLSSGLDESSTAELQRALLVTYDTDKIQQLSLKLAARISKQQITFLSDKWIIPRDIYHAIQSIPIVKVQIFVHILIAKAGVCMQLKHYSKAGELMQVADTSSKSLSYKMSKLLRWEMLRADMLHYENTAAQMPAAAAEQLLQELVKKAKSCIGALHTEHDVKPNPNVLALCAACLLTAKEWDYLSSLGTSYSGPIEFSRLLSDLCKELPQLKNARKAARELWESVVSIFINNTQGKRTGPGVQGLPRENNLGPLSQRQFITFLSEIKEPIALSALMSCLTKLYGILKDDITSEISSDYVTIWPTALGNASSLSIDGVSEAVSTVMEHALSLNPSNQSWLQTQADIHFAHLQYSQALRYYLQVGVVITSYFTEPVTKNVYSEEVYKRMIKCCSYLQCFTQVAVLCQFLDEVDYASAFKFLQERSTHDAMDTFYDCIWDTTILEFLINLHTKRGEIDKRQTVMKLIGQMELNSNNSPEILYEAARVRKAKFLQAMAKQFL